MKPPEPYSKVPSMMTYPRLQPHYVQSVYFVPSRPHTRPYLAQPQPLRHLARVQPTSVLKPFLPIEVKDQGDTLVLQVTIPGLTAKDLEVQASRQTVMLLSSSFSPFQSWRQIINLPSPIQHTQVKASFIDGTLTLTLPKVQAESTQAVKVIVGQQSNLPANQVDSGEQASVNRADDPEFVGEPALPPAPVAMNWAPNLAHSQLEQDFAASSKTGKTVSPVSWENDPELLEDLWAAA